MVSPSVGLKNITVLVMKLPDENFSVILVEPNFGKADCATPCKLYMIDLLTWLKSIGML